MPIRAGLGVTLQRSFVLLNYVVNVGRALQTPLTIASWTMHVERSAALVTPFRAVKFNQWYGSRWDVEVASVRWMIIRCRERDLRQTLKS